MASAMKSSSGIAHSLLLLSGQQRRADGWRHQLDDLHLVSPNCSRMDSLSRWIAALDAL